MTLIKSISGIRGTIGGKVSEGLTPIDIVKFSAAFGFWIKKYASKEKKLKIVVGRDARISGELVNSFVVNTFMSLGFDVIDIGLATTPTVEIAVPYIKADAGVIITASHNPKQWNALKLLNSKGEFISGIDGEEVLKIAEEQSFLFEEVDHLGTCIKDEKTFLNLHIDLIKTLKLVDIDAIKKANFKVAIDCVNSVGGIAIPMLLKELGVENVLELYCEPNGYFPHNPEPLPENLDEISKYVNKNQAHVGFVVDPDVDRLAIICQDGTMFGEEYTLVAVADYILKNSEGKNNTVSNLSSTQALKDVTVKNGGQYFASAVGEVNVVAMMKKNDAIIGGEGNGGIIYPELHYGRDALVGIALFLTHLAKSGKTCTALRETYPNYFISKNKIELTDDIDLDKVLDKIKTKYSKQPVNDIDGVKIEFDGEWVHLRKSNTEKIIRIYSESDSITKANSIAKKLMGDISQIIKE